MEIYYKILNLILPALFSLFGVVLSNILLSKNRKIEMAYRIYDKRVDAYQALYSGLIPLKQELHKFTIRSDDSRLKGFPIREKLDSVRNIFAFNEIYYSADCIEKYRMLQSCVTSIMIDANMFDRGMSEEDDNARMAERFVDKCLQVIKKDIGLDKIEKDLSE